ncbi:pantoate--beta-alanine ligase [Intrasporangium sp.]|uniref:pantoate--beta-alanine ligase n=1 Tax=Intrasporangium sp. TaxID=1925024 RepID=UPI003221E297
MQVAHRREDVRVMRAGLGTVALVPTMGFLHDGHLSLVELARRHHDAVAVSVFVNPTQFGPGEDLDSYPRDLDHDLGLLEQAGVDLVWVPEVADVYPVGSSTRVRVEGPLTAVLEGGRRPGHFDGVATVVTILLGAIRPDALVIGAKDAQQVVVLRQVVRDLAIGVQVVVGPTWREPDGLAMSSRNVYLTPVQRAAAPVLRRSLTEVEQRYAAGERDAETLRSLVRSGVATQSEGSLEYVSVADPVTLAELDRIGPAGALVSLAADFGRARLLDNVTLPGAGRAPATVR